MAETAQQTARDRLNTRDEAAEQIRMKSQTLAVWKSTGRYSLPCVKIGNRAMYRQSDIDAFIAANTINTGANSER